MPGAVFLEALENNTAFAMEQMARLTGFIRNLNRKVFEFNALNAKKRLRAELLRMAGDID